MRNRSAILYIYVPVKLAAWAQKPVHLSDDGFCVRGRHLVQDVGKVDEVNALTLQEVQRFSVAVVELDVADATNFLKKSSQQFSHLNLCQGF